MRNYGGRSHLRTNRKREYSPTIVGMVTCRSGVVSLRLIPKRSKDCVALMSALSHGLQNLSLRWTQIKHHLITNLPLRRGKSQFFSVTYTWLRETLMNSLRVGDRGSFCIRIVLQSQLRDYLSQDNRSRHRRIAINHCAVTVSCHSLLRSYCVAPKSDRMLVCIQLEVAKRVPPSLSSLINNLVFFCGWLISLRE